MPQSSSGTWWIEAFDPWPGNASARKDSTVRRVPSAPGAGILPSYKAAEGGTDAYQELALVFVNAVASIEKVLRGRLAMRIFVTAWGASGSLR